jgi:formylglycine-generating enzyme required for sulfatase activity
MPNTQTYQFLSHLMTALQANGFRVGTGQQLRLQQLIEQLPEDISVEQLKFRLAPIFAKSKEEQQLFYELYEVAKSSLDIKSQKKHEEITPPKNPFKKWIWFVSFLLFAVVLVLVYLRLNPIAAPYLYKPLPIISETVLVGDSAVLCVDNAFRANEILEDRADKKEIIKYTLCNGLSEGTHLGLGVYNIDATGCVHYLASDTGKVRLCTSMAFEFSENVETIVDTVWIEIDIENAAQPITINNKNDLSIRPLPIKRSIEELEVDQASVWANEYYAFQAIFRNWVLSRNGLIISIIILLLFNYGLIFFTALKNWFVSPKEIKNIPYKINFERYKKQLKKLLSKDVDAVYDQLSIDLKKEWLSQLEATKVVPTFQEPEQKFNTQQQQRNYLVTDDPFSNIGNIENNPQSNTGNSEISIGEFEIQLSYFVEDLDVEYLQEKALYNHYNFRMDYLKNVIVSTLVAVFMTAVMFGFLYFFHFKFAVAILLGILLIVIVRYLNRNRKIIAEIEPSKKPPFAWNIQIPDNHKVVYNENFHNALNQLRQRTEDQFYRLNVAETVQATIQSGGQIDFQYTRQTKPPEYLMLIDRRSAANHRAALFNMLYESFKSNDVLVERFYFDGDIRLVFNENNKGGILLKNLKYQFQDARLLILSDGYTLLNGRTGKLSKWTNVLNTWKNKALMTPNAPSTWGRKERQLATQFDVLPATIQGFQHVIEAFEDTELTDFSKWQQIQDSSLKPIQFEGDLIQTLEKYYAKGDDERLIKWIAACAVYPTIHWDLTLSMGKLIADRTDDLGFLDIDNLLEINRLDWFVNGKIPEQVRLELLQYLEKNDAELLQEVRQYIHELLQNNPPPEDSAVFEDYQMSVITNQMLMENDAKKQKELETEFKKMIEAGVSPDFTVLKYLDRKQTALDFIVPENWKNLVYNEGKPFFGRRYWTWAIPIWIVLALGLMTYKPSIPTCNGKVIEYNERELCLKNQADEILFKEFLTLEFIESKEYLQADSMVFSLMFNKTKESFNIRKKADSTLNMVDYNLLSFTKNVSTAFYNVGVGDYNKYKQEMRRPSRNQLLTAESYKIDACQFFKKAYALDSTAQIFQKLVQQCLTGDEFEGYIIPNVAGKVVDIRTGKGLKSVKVSLENGNAIYTDLDGNYRLKLSNEPLKVLKLRFQKKYYFDLVKTFELTESTELLETVSIQSSNDLKQNNKKDKSKIKQKVTDPKLPNLPPNTDGGYQDNTGVIDIEQREILPRNPAEQKIPLPNVSIHKPAVIKVKGGSFTMGSDEYKANDNPKRSVSVNDFSIGKYEITNKEFLDFLNSKEVALPRIKEWISSKLEISKIRFENNKWEITKGYENHPTTGVTWLGAEAYCEWLSTKTGDKYRLPTEAEWEYAARGGNNSKNTIYAGSDYISSVAWYQSNAKSTYEKGRKQANELGIYDMSGNVWEWCSDWYGKDYYKENIKGGIRNPKGEIRGIFKVARGGSFTEKENKCTVSYRGYYTNTRQFKNGGFRVVLE